MVREFQDVPWDRLEREDLPPRLRPLIAKKDPAGLLAALDAMPSLDSELLVVRGQLRAGADRCDEALGDVERARDLPADLERAADRVHARCD
jgi:hypothetical protein